MILSAQSHQAVTVNLENFTWTEGSLPDTLAVLRLAEKRCGPEFNTDKSTKINQGQTEPETTVERPARTEQDMAVVKVMQSLAPQIKFNGCRLSQDLATLGSGATRRAGMVFGSGRTTIDLPCADCF